MSFSGNERFYDDDDTERQAVVHIGKCGGIFRTFDGMYGKQVIFFCTFDIIYT